MSTSDDTKREKNEKTLTRDVFFNICNYLLSMEWNECNEIKNKKKYVTPLTW